MDISSPQIITFHWKYYLHSAEPFRSYISRARESERGRLHSILNSHLKIKTLLYDFVGVLESITNSLE